MARFTESLALCRASNDREGKAHNLNEIGILLTQQGRTARARASFREALHIYRSLGKAAGVSKTLNNLAATHVLDKDRTGAVRVYRELLAWDEETGNRLGAAVTHVNLGAMYEMEPCRCDLAALEYGKGLDLLSALGDRRRAADVRRRLERLGVSCPEPEQAAASASRGAEKSPPQ